MWHIAKRELYDNLNSLRFALATVLLLALMLTNAVVYLRKHPVRMQKYRDAATESLNTLTSRTDLYDLAQKGPEKLYKKPSPLRFCTDGGDSLLPAFTRAASHFRGGELKSFWRMTYPSATPNLKNIDPDATQIDWAFVIGYVLSLIALLFTFDAISGEREHGTLRLMLANPIPRHTILIGKFLGAFISVNIPFVLAVLMNLLVISTSSAVHLDASEWGRLGIIIGIAMLYLSLFLVLGLLVSARVRQSSVSLVILLLIWVSFVVFMPNTLASIASRFSPARSYDAFQEDRRQTRRAILEVYYPQLNETDDPSKRMVIAGECVTEDATQDGRLREAFLSERISQVSQARAITRISPVGIAQHLLEVFAGTGLTRHLQFVENVQLYAREYHEFIADTERADPESPHIIGVRAGMSKKKVSPESIPIFEDTISLSRDFNTAAVDLLLLALFFVVLLSGSYLAFVRVEV